MYIILFLFWGFSSEIYYVVNVLCKCMFQKMCKEIKNILLNNDFIRRFNKKINPRFQITFEPNEYHTWMAVRTLMKFYSYIKLSYLI